MNYFFHVLTILICFGQVLSKEFQPKPLENLYSDAEANDIISHLLDEPILLEGSLGEMKIHNAVSVEIDKEWSSSKELFESLGLDEEKVVLFEGYDLMSYGIVRVKLSESFDIIVETIDTSVDDNESSFKLISVFFVPHLNEKYIMRTDRNRLFDFRIGG